MRPPPARNTFSTLDLGEWRLPDGAELGADEHIPTGMWQLAQQAAMSLPEEISDIQPEVYRLVEAREEAREEARRRPDWANADALRARIGALGWQVQDTEDGPLLTPLPSQDQA